MLDQPLLVLGGIDLPNLLQPDAEFRRLAVRVELELVDQLLGEAAAGALGKQRVLADELHAAGEAVLVRAVPGDAHVAGGDAAHRALPVIEHLDRGKAGIDLDAERLGLARQIAAEMAERAGEAMMIVHQRRHHDVRQPDRARRRHPVEAVFGDLGLEQAILVGPPFRDELVERNGIDHRA